MARLEERFGISAVAVADGVRFELERAHERVVELVGALSDLIHSITVAQPSLEDVFLRRTGRGFWDDAGEAREVLERYRELDVAIQSGGRYDEPIAWLEELLGAPGRRPGELARNLERAARSLRAWEERLAEDGPGAVWLLLHDICPRATATDWLGELVGMETA